MVTQKISRLFECKVKKKVIIGILAVILFAVLLSYTSKTDCGKLENQINDLLKSANHCNYDSDCTVYNKPFRCPFGCYNLVNTGSDLVDVERLVEKYQKSCGVCIYDCPHTPDSTDIGCIANECLDMRFSAVGECYKIYPFMGHGCLGDCLGGQGDYAFFPKGTNISKKFGLYVPEEILNISLALYSESVCKTCFQKFQIRKEGVLEGVSFREFCDFVVENDLDVFIAERE